MLFDFSRKNPNRVGVDDIDTLLESPLEILDMSLYPKKFRRKKAFTPGNSTNLRDNPSKLQSKKTRLMEVPHQFFLNTIGISTSFLVEPWNFHVFSSRSPEIPCPQPPLLFGFFLEYPILSLERSWRVEPNQVGLSAAPNIHISKLTQATLSAIKTFRKK